MNFVTLKFTLDRRKLPRRFKRLSRCHGWISIVPTGADASCEEQDYAAITCVLHRWLTPVREVATVEEYGQILGAIVREFMDWTASAFDVFGIDVERERLVAGIATEASWTPRGLEEEQHDDA